MKQPIGAGFNVLQFKLALAPDQAVFEGVAEAGRAVEIDLRNDMAVAGEDMHVPALAKGVARSGVRAAVDEVGHGVLALWIERRRSLKDSTRCAAARVRDLGAVGGDVVPSQVAAAASFGAEVVRASIGRPAQWRLHRAWP